MTLVELLVVVAIMVLLLAVSVPMLKPMLESRRTSNAAQVLAGAFQHARAKSIQDQKSRGIRLVPFDTAPSVALQLRMYKENRIDAVNSPNIRVRVEEGKIIPYRFVETTSEWERLMPSDSQFVTVMEQFNGGEAVQFNRIGREFVIGEMEGVYCTLAAPYANLNLPDDPASDDAMEYRVTQWLAPMTWLPPMVMPQGTVVDIAYSGGETVNFLGADKTEDDIAGGAVPPNFTSGDEVIVMFSPAGHVDMLYINGVPRKVNETLYFCVGQWDRQTDENRNSLAEDKKSNLAVPTTYWVTLHPKTGTVHVAENAPIRQSSTTPLAGLRDARKFASEYFWNVGN
jgi:hypothetical protein